MPNYSVSTRISKNSEKKQDMPKPCKPWLRRLGRHAPQALGRRRRTRAGEATPNPHRPPKQPLRHRRRSYLPSPLAFSFRPSRSFFAGSEQIAKFLFIPQISPQKSRFEFRNDPISVRSDPIVGPLAHYIQSRV